MAFRTQKISQMTPKGADLEATDLIEVSTIESGSYVTRSITGQELIDAIPLPPTGLTVGTTPIASGTIGRVLFQGTGNVLQQSSSLFWDGTNNRLGIGTSIPISPIHILSPIGQQSTITLRTLDNTTSGGYTGINCFDNLDNLAFSFAYGNSGSLLPNSAIIGTRTATGVMSFVTGPSATVRATLFSTGNFAINTTTDAGFRLDVNGTARVQGATTMANGLMRIDNTATGGNVTFNFLGTSPFFDSDNAINFGTNSNGGVYGNAVIQVWNQSNLNNLLALYDGTNTANERLRVTKGGNLLINTTTDAGFRLDVNGTARVSGVFSVGSDTARIDLWRSSGAFGGRIGTGYSNPAVNHVYIQCDTNSKAILIDDSNRTLFSSSNGDTTTASAQVTINSSTRGFLPPRMTTTQRNAIASPAAGLVVYDNTDNKHYGYNGTTWNAFY